ncbi:MAG TPA: exodeoxyribonuclease III [Spirochaetota bacterium]|nr:exodeoxyribonuclease III [Spirochaetota bacterium]
MKIISWNVNGIRSVITKGFDNFLKAEKPDILCLQETRADESQVKFELEGYRYRYWNPAEKKGYSGTAVFCVHEPLSVSKELGMEKHDGEGRVITLEYKKFWLVNVYVPNSKRGLERLDYRHNSWDVDFLSYLKKLEKKKPVIVCGDFNVAHKEIDLANPRTNVKNAGFTPEEREGFDNFISAGFVDTFREFTKDGGHYTWWSNMANSRERNVGWRIDYFLVSEKIKPDIKKSYILPSVMGSDHAPVVVETDLS